jgi:PAB-dependent poly(A)-specific ribonuclease subunit 2
VDTPSPLLHLAPTDRNVFSASLSGQLSILDPRLGYKPSASIRPVQAHSGGLNGADAQGNLICTWGWTHKGGHPLADVNVRLYDVRTLRALPTVSFAAGPAFCLLHPTDPSKMIISSQQGMVQIVDLTSSTPGAFQQLDVNSFVTSMALSPAGDYLAFGDADGQVHLWTTHDVTESAPRNQDGTIALPPFNGYSGVKPEWPDAPDPPPAVTWDDKT